VLLLGDFNLEPPGSIRHKISDPGVQDGGRTGTGYQARAHARRWQEIFDSLTEITTGAPTHFYPPGLFVNEIDRIFTSVPQCSCCLFAQKCGVKHDPVYDHIKKLSDHAPKFWKVKTKHSKPRAQQQVKPEWCSHPLFLKRFEELSILADFDSLDRSEQNVVIKRLMREAGTFVRDFLFEQCPERADVMLTRYASISRAVFTKNHRLAEILLEHSELAAQHITFNEKCEPILINPSVFTEECRAANDEFAKHTVNTIQRETIKSNDEFGSAKKKSRIQAAKRKGSLWRPTRSKLILAGLKVTCIEAERLGIEHEHGNVTDARSRALVMQAAWGPTFANADPLDETRAREMVQQYSEAVIWDWSGCLYPSIDTFVEYYRCVKNSAPGKDGIPNAAWKALRECEVVGKHSLSLFNAFTQASPLPDDFNDGLFVFIPKDTGNNDEAFYADPLETRPLTLKNTDNKGVAGVINWIVHPVVKRSACSLQNGFIKGRQLVQNPVDLDFHARLEALRFSGDETHFMHYLSELVISKVGITGLIPLLLLFDFAAAFPSVRHAWMHFFIEGSWNAKGATQCR